MSNKARKMLVLLMIILKEAGPTAACSSSCSSFCGCSSRGLTSVPQDLPTDITGLSLQDNAITTLSQSDFSRYRSLSRLYLGYNQISMIHNKTFHSLTSLTELYLHSNRLTTLSAGIFVGLGNLQELWLYNNQLTSLTADIFDGLGNLDKLDLDRNDIHSIEAGTFNDTTKLRYLGLQHNNIRTITADTLGNLLQLQTLRLSGNNINTFPVEALSNLNISVLSELTLDSNQLETLPVMAYDILASISTVYIRYNPWQCDCRMAPFKQRMSGSYPFEKQIRCAGPANLTGQLLRDVTLNPEDLICDRTTPVYFTPSTKHIPDSTDPPFASNVTLTESTTGPADGGIVLSVPLVATLGAILGLLLICTIAFAVWRMSKRRQRDPPQQGFSNTNPTGTSSGHEQIRLQAVGTSAEVNSQSETSHSDTEDSEHVYDAPIYEDLDTAGYDTTGEVDQSESGAGNRQSLDSFGYLVLPSSLPPENETGPQAAAQVEPADAAARKIVSPSQTSQPGSGQIQHLSSFNDDYEVPSPCLYPGEGPQPHKYVNSHVAAAAKDPAAGPQDVEYDYENEDKIESTKEGPQSHKHENSQVTAAAKDAAAGPQDVVYEYENAAAGPQDVDYEYENDDETARLITLASQIDEELVDNQSQTAAAPGADSPHHYEPLRNPSSQQQHTYTPLMPHGSQGN
ncbi:uncharacterized protein LOC144903366 [Branchiostoma floridae x Branchiostoma belcheri]